MYNLPYIKMKIVHLSQVMADCYTNSGSNLIVVLMVISYQSLFFKSLYPGLPYSDLRKSIDKWVTLVAYYKQEIKQLGQFCVNVCNSSMGKKTTCNFFVVEDKCNPSIGLNNSIAFQLLSVNVLFTDKWTGNVHSKRSNSRYDEMETEDIGQQKGQLTHDYIVKKYAKFFREIGRFQCTPAKIQLKSNAVPVQKPAK